MIVPLLFWTLTLIGCGYAVAVGGKDGLWASLSIVSASILTIPAERLGSLWASTELAVMIVDAGLFLSLYALALRSDRFFPIWIAGFQLIAVASHIGTMIAPAFAPKIYKALESVWAIPITLSMVIGIAADRAVERPERILPSRTGASRSAAMRVRSERRRAGRRR